MSYLGECLVKGSLPTIARLLETFVQPLKGIIWMVDGRPSILSGYKNIPVLHKKACDASMKLVRTEISKQ